MYVKAIRGVVLILSVALVLWWRRSVLPAAVQRRAVNQSHPAHRKGSVPRARGPVD